MCGRFVFAHNCHEAGLISDTEWSIYCDWHSFLLNALPLSFHGIIYLRTDPKVGGRMERGRGWERRGMHMGKEEGRDGKLGGREGGEGNGRGWLQ